MNVMRRAAAQHTESTADCIVWDWRGILLEMIVLVLAFGVYRAHGKCPTNAPTPFV